MGQKNSLIDKLGLPVEKTADCNNCRMCGPAGGTKPYLSEVKCCTYYPFLPNYAVGGILADGGEGARRVLHIIQQRQWSLPIGLVAPPSYQLKFRHKDLVEFGRNTAFRCPFLSAGQCTVWKHRNSECSTYFCIHDNGEAGKQKWLETSEKIFGEEMKYSQNLMLECGFLWPEVEQNLEFIRYKPDEIPTDMRSYQMPALLWSKYWKHWDLNPVEFYKKCWDLID